MKAGDLLVQQKEEKVDLITPTTGTMFLAWTCQHIGAVQEKLLLGYRIMVNLTGSVDANSKVWCDASLRQQMKIYQRLRKQGEFELTCSPF